MTPEGGRRGLVSRMWGAADSAATRAISALRRGPAGADASAELHDVRRMHLALEAGGLGTWQWSLTGGAPTVTWDERLEELYGLEPGTFDGSLATYRALVHPDDRAHVAAAVDEGMKNGHAWRFDHRVVWPDGSVHWLEGRGEPLYDRRGTVVGAIGVTVNVDARHARLDAETRAREDAEQSSIAIQRLADIATALAGAMTVDEVGGVIVEQAVSALH